MTNQCLPRSGANLIAAVAAIDPEHNPSLQRRDVTGDGIPETFCNLFVRLCLALLEVLIPEMLANDLYGWFSSPEGQGQGWSAVTAWEAITRAEAGFPTIGVWKNTAGHGHIIIVTPARDPSGKPLLGVMHSAQAGAKNWSNEPIERAGLRASAYSFFTHA